MQLRYASLLFMLFLTQNSFTVSEEENKILADAILYVDFLIESGNINEAIIRNTHLINMIDADPNLYNLRTAVVSFEEKISSMCNRKRKRDDESDFSKAMPDASMDESDQMNISNEICKD